jgi:mono/diheme cytochrome c family protein
MRAPTSCLAILLAAAVAAQDPAAKVAPAADRIDFGKQVVPILLQRCIECHGPKQQKGDLRLDSKAALFPEGDEAAWSVVAGKPDESELIRRIGLPLADEEIMPNKGEPLSKAQQEVLHRWVAEGAEWPATGDKAIADALAAQVLPKITFDLPPVSAAQQEAIAAAVAVLRQKGVVVQQVAADTPALDVNFALLRDKVTDADVALCRPLAPVLVWLNLSRTAVGDGVAEHLAALPELRRLHVANTRLGDPAFRALAALPKLEYLNAYGTGLTDDGLAALGGLPRLQQVYAWQTKATGKGKQALVTQLPLVAVDLGDYVEGRLAAAEREIAAREARNKPVNTMCPVLDKPVDPNCTVEHDGRRIAFCCGKCKAAFEKEPGKYLGKLPK